MAQQLKFTNKEKATLIKEFTKMVTACNDPENFKFTYNLGNIKLLPKQRPQVHLSTKANNKIRALIDTCSEEIGWLGIVERPTTLQFLISDIMVYPQKVTGASITTDDEEYIKWSMQIPTETYNKLRMQGHSHVHMGVSPSPADKEMYTNYYNNLKENDFFIFFIQNKRDDCNCYIYDLKTNLKYDTKDIDVHFGNEIAFKIWAKEIMQKFIAKRTPPVIEKRYTEYNLEEHLTKQEDDIDAFLKRHYKI